MKPAPFRYFAPSRLEEALDLLAQHGMDAKVLAGGQSLIPTMNFRLARPEVLIDLNGLSDLFYIRPEKKRIRIGAMTRKSQVEKSEEIRELAPLVHEAMPYIGHPQIRNRGTMGGSIAHADPASELPAAMVALEARFQVKNRKKERWIAASDFFLGSFTTAMEPAEILTEIEIPKMPAHTGCAFEETSRRQGDYALVGVAVALTLDGKQRCEKAHVVFFSVGEKPLDSPAARRLLQGQAASPELVEQVAATAAAELEPASDIHASSEYRRQLAKTLSARAVQRAFERARI